MANYLSNRTMIVNVNGTFYKYEKLTAGVPQGSILGPLLFINFLNHICALKLEKYFFTLFADVGEKICAVRYMISKIYGVSI